MVQLWYHSAANPSYAFPFFLGLGTVPSSFVSKWVPFNRKFAKRVAKLAYGYKNQLVDRRKKFPIFERIAWDTRQVYSDPNGELNLKFDIVWTHYTHSGVQLTVFVFFIRLPLQYQFDSIFGIKAV